ncbi:MAG: hypothetical protein RIQ33_1853 [Bacteroidota bacterium]|jgi:hypothetical protein
MNKKIKYFIPIFIALVCLMYQAMPVHQLFFADSAFSVSLIEEDDTDTEKENSTLKKIKSEGKDFVAAELLSLFFNSYSSFTYYYLHLPQSFEVNTVFAPPPELV